MFHFSFWNGVSLFTLLQCVPLTLLFAWNVGFLVHFIMVISNPWCFFWQHCLFSFNMSTVSLQSRFGTLAFLYNVPFSFMKFGVSSFILLQGVSFLSFGWNVSILVHLIMVIYIVLLLFPFFLQRGSFSFNMSAISCNLNLTLVF